MRNMTEDEQLERLGKMRSNLNGWSGGRLGEPKKGYIEDIRPHGCTENCYC